MRSGCQAPRLPKSSSSGAGPKEKLNDPPLVVAGDQSPPIGILMTVSRADNPAIDVPMTVPGATAPVIEVPSAFTGPMAPPSGTETRNPLPRGRGYPCG